MKKLALAALALAGLTQATGCIFVSDDTSDGAQFTYSWTIDQPCAAVGANGVSFVATPSVGQAFDDIYNCEQQASHDSPTMPLDTYTISGSVIDDSVTPAVVFDEITMTGTLDQLDEIVPLPTFNFSVAPPSVDISFGVTFSSTSTNCDNTNMGGLGIVQVSVDVYDTGSATCLGTYTITGTDQDGQPINDSTCHGEPYMLCVENTVTLTINDLPPGTYDLVAIGWKGCNDAVLDSCYAGTKTVDASSSGDVGDITGMFLQPTDPLYDPDCEMCKPWHDR